MAYTVINTNLFNSLSTIDMMGRSVEQRAQRFVNSANAARSTTELENVLCGARAHMGIELVGFGS